MTSTIITREYIARGNAVFARYPDKTGETLFFIGEYDTPATAQAVAEADNQYWQKLTLNRVSTDHLAKFFD
jgi:hypothetical protein